MPETEPVMQLFHAVLLLVDMYVKDLVTEDEIQQILYDLLIIYSQELLSEFN